MSDELPPWLPLRDDDGVYVDSPVHAAFELTYASYLVMPRMVLEAMPYQWQKDFCDLMEELHAKIDYGSPEYTVLRKDKGRFCKDPLRNYRHPGYGLLEFKEPQ